MNQKNRELARRNTELLEEISRLTDIHSDILKGNIKEKYNRTRTYNKLLEQIDHQIETVREMLQGSLNLKESLVQIMEVKETETESNHFKESMKILDTICGKEGPLKEKNLNKRKRKSGL